MYKTNFTRRRIAVVLRSYKLQRIDIDMALDSIFTVVDGDLRIKSSSFTIGVGVGILLTVIFGSLI